MTISDSTPPASYPRVEVLVDGAWCGGRLLFLVQAREGGDNWRGLVHYRSPGGHTDAVGLFAGDEMRATRETADVG